MTTDPRTLQLAKNMHRLAREKATKLPEWKDLPLSEREKATTEARLWLRAAVEAGIAPVADRPTDKHDAVWVDSWRVPDQPVVARRRDPPPRVGVRSVLLQARDGGRGRRVPPHRLERVTALPAV